jgi:hypothetical protein
MWQYIINKLEIILGVRQIVGCGKTVGAVG